MKKKMRLPVAVLTALMLALGVASPVAAASAPKVEDVEYDYEDREVNIDFVNRVQWKSGAKVKIMRNGKNYAKYIIEKDSDDVDVKVKKLAYGKKYTYKVTGVKKMGTRGYKTVKGSFYAYDD